MLASNKIQESRGFEIIGTNPSENSIEELLKNTEYTGYHMSSDPDERDFFLKCPLCHALVQDTGLLDKVQCDSCKKIVNIPENNFQEVKQASLYEEPKKKDKKYCKKIRKFCNKLSFIIPFLSSNPMYPLPSYKHVMFYINKEKLDNSEYKGKDFVDIMNNVIIPFFQYKSRNINKDKIFEIDGIEFKVMSTYPNYLIGKVTSKTSISCNNYYSCTTNIINATFLTLKRRDFESNEYIVNKIVETPFPTQKFIIEGTECRINTYDLFVRNCEPKYGVITNETNIRVINRSIEILKNITIAILKNEENPELTDKKNNKLIYNNFIHPYFHWGNKRYIERGDTIKIGKLEIFILKANPSTGFVTEDVTKINIKYNYTLDQSQNELNEQIERESLENHEIRNNRININNSDEFIDTSNNNSRNNLQMYSNFQHRMRILHTLLAHRRRLIMLNQQLNNLNINNFGDDDNIININFNFLNEENITNNNNNGISEEIIQNLPVFKIDEKFMEISQKEDNKNEHFEKCVICMEKYEINDEVKTLPCFHIFHKECIDQWLKSGKSTCPICKTKVNSNNIDNDFNDE